MAVRSDGGGNMRRWKMLSNAKGMIRALACGAVLAALAGPAGATGFHVLYAFQGGTDGAGSVSALIEVGGTLYGTTSAGGTANAGTVFSVTPDGSETVLHAFQGGTDGAAPYGPLLYANGNFYGTTSGGGGTPCTQFGVKVGCGTVFVLTPAGAESVLYAFKGRPVDGSAPGGGLIAANGVFYGNTLEGGTKNCAKPGCGTVFSVTPAGAEQMLRSLTYREGSAPSADLLKLGNRLFGTAPYGGANGNGTIFSLTALGRRLEIYPTTAGPPSSGLTNIAGTLYGTAMQGNGNVYAFTPPSTQKIIYSFAGGADGLGPISLLDVRGTLYGVTVQGGTGTRCGNEGCGTVFSVTTSGTKTLLHSFTGTDGENPQAGLVRLGDKLYGATSNGGAHGHGTVYSIKP